MSESFRYFVVASWSVRRGENAGGIAECNIRAAMAAIRRCISAKRTHNAAFWAWHAFCNAAIKHMNKALGIALLAVGIGLLIFGISATDSFASHFSRFFTGNPTDKAMWLVLGGVASLVVGGIMVFRPVR